MARTPSNMASLGTFALDFDLPDVISEKNIKLADFKEKPALLVMFISRHCPFVVHVENELARIGKDYPQIGIVAICSNDIENYPEDAPDQLREQANRLQFTFPYLYDASQETAKNYKAACTPDFFLYDQSRRLVYRGQLDDSRPNSGIPVTGSDLRNAIEAVLSGHRPSLEQRPSLGCNIKWKSGNEP